MSIFSTLSSRKVFKDVPKGFSLEDFIPNLSEFLDINKDNQEISFLLKGLEKVYKLYIDEKEKNKILNTILRTFQEEPDKNSLYIEAILENHTKIVDTLSKKVTINDTNQYEEDSIIVTGKNKNEDINKVEVLSTGNSKEELNISKEQKEILDYIENGGLQSSINDATKKTKKDVEEIYLGLIKEKDQELNKKDQEIAKLKVQISRLENEKVEKKGIKIDQKV